ncbi:MAG: PilZ domain-containing protein [Acidobacteriia bacterium]|nr:PilZ domain-containing protein [Terriglobia bacterium]
MNAIGRRRSDRILAPLRIHVTGVDAAWDPFEEDTVTVSVNKHGACISLEHVLLPEQRIDIKNLENDIATQFRVVGELREVFGSRREWGVETLCPECNIWGLEFALPPEDLQAKALICCAACKNGALSPLSSIEYDVLLFTGMISRHCEHCGETTRWQPCEHLPAPEVLPRTSPAAERVDERRKHKRLKLSMLLRVRNARGESEVAQTLDVSKGGVCFLGKRQYQVGDVLYLTLPSLDKPVPIETRGLVVRARSGPRGTLYGVRFEKQ